MDSIVDDAARLREARLLHVEAIEQALACARLVLAGRDDPAARALAGRIARAALRADALHRRLRIGHPPISDISPREPDSALG